MTERQKMVCELYPDFTSKEISAMYSISSARVTQIARELGVRHNEETEKRIFNAKNRFKRPVSEEVRQKISKTKKRIFKMERLRIMSGMQQHTNMVLTLHSEKMHKARQHYICRYRFFGTGMRGETHILLYDENTRRPKPNRMAGEQYMAKRYGFVFMSVEEYYKQDKNYEDKGLQRI